MGQLANPAALISTARSSPRTAGAGLPLRSSIANLANLANTANMANMANMANTANTANTATMTIVIVPAAGMK